MVDLEPTDPSLCLETGSFLSLCFYFVSCSHANFHHWHRLCTALHGRQLHDRCVNPWHAILLLLIAVIFCCFGIYGFSGGGWSSHRHLPPTLPPRAVDFRKRGQLDRPWSRWSCWQKDLGQQLAAGLFIFWVISGKALCLSFIKLVQCQLHLIKSNPASSIATQRSSCEGRRQQLCTRTAQFLSDRFSHLFTRLMALRTLHHWQRDCWPGVGPSESWPTTAQDA